MSDEPDSLVLRYLRQIDLRLAHLGARIDRVGDRFMRLERRLGLADMPA